MFVQRQLTFDARSEHSAVPQPRHWFWSAISQSWPIYGEALVASLLINLFALVTPFFTMNVYDRVVPNLALETLWVLTIGVALVFGFDFLMRTLRAYFIDVAGKRVDVILSANIFASVLGIRMDARPASVGAFANNVQEFESFREFVTSATITTLVDLPFALLFIAAMAWIGGPIAWIPLAAVPLIVGFGLAAAGPVVPGRAGELPPRLAAAGDAGRIAGRPRDASDATRRRARAATLGAGDRADRKARPAGAVPVERRHQFRDASCSSSHTSPSSSAAST